MHRSGSLATWRRRFYQILEQGSAEDRISVVLNHALVALIVVTLIATIFLPLTFITGFFGMNFGYLTNELIDTRLSFVVFGVLLLIAATLAFIIYFRRRGWIGHHRGETAVPTRAPLGDRRNGVRASRG